MFAFWIVILILAAVALGISFVIPRVVNEGKRDELHPRRIVRRITAGVVVLFTIIMFFTSMFVTVSTKNVGIETAFGRVDGHLSNGLHIIAPWKSVTEMDAAIQTDSFTGNNCVNVRIANQQTACVDISIRWRIQPNSADYLFQNYRTFDQVRDSLVTRELRSAVNNQLNNYNPLNSISVAATTASNYPTNPSLTQIASAVTKQMQHEIGSDIDVINTIIPIMTFDQQTQSRLNQLQQQEAQTRIAVAAQQTAQAQAVANQALAASVDNNTNVLISQCLTTQEQIVKDGGIPYTSCFPGGASSTVVVPQK